MSYRQCFFVIPATTSFSTILTVFKEFADELIFENDYKGCYLAANTPEDAAQRGAWLLHMTATPAPYGRVPRGFFTDRWYNQPDPLYIAVYDDQHGIYLWERHAEDGVASILTDGHRVGLRNQALTCDYPQRGFTNAQLDEAIHKPEDALTEAERRALMEYDDALTLGLRQYGIQAGRGALLDLLYNKQVWPLKKINPAKPKSVAPPRDLGPVVDEYVEHHTFTAHKLAPRYY